MRILKLTGTASTGRSFFAGLIVFFLAMLCAPQVSACRFWCAVSEKAVSPEVLDSQLLNMPRSLKSLGEEYSDGWSVGYYFGTYPVIARGISSAYDDGAFDKAVLRASEVAPKLVVAHIRKASSGCSGYIPNPHPFERKYNGKSWLFGHNGTIAKDVLMALIGDTLEVMKPTACTSNPPDSWIDSELFFIFLLKEINQHKGDVKAGIRAGIQKLSDALGEQNKEFNFFLTDGETLWVFRYGLDLYFSFNEEQQLWMIASIPPSEDREGWEAFNDGDLMILRPDAKPEVINMQ